MATDPCTRVDAAPTYREVLARSGRRSSRATRHRPASTVPGLADSATSARHYNETRRLRVDLARFSRDPLREPWHPLRLNAADSSDRLKSSHNLATPLPSRIDPILAGFRRVAHWPAQAPRWLPIRGHARTRGWSRQGCCQFHKVEVNLCDLSEQRHAAPSAHGAAVQEILCGGGRGEAEGRRAFVENHRPQAIGSKSEAHSASARRDACWRRRSHGLPAVARARPGCRLRGL
jgi:hypothetical protein